ASGIALLPHIEGIDVHRWAAGDDGAGASAAPHADLQIVLRLTHRCRGIKYADDVHELPTFARDFETTTIELGYIARIGIPFQARGDLHRLAQRLCPGRHARQRTRRDDNRRIPVASRFGWIEQEALHVVTLASSFRTTRAGLPATNVNGSTFVVTT